MEKGVQENRVYDLVQLAECAGLTVRTLRKAIKENRLKAYKAYGKLYVFGSHFHSSIMEIDKKK